MPHSDPRLPVVLVHGAWHGAWCWDRVRPIIEARGCRVLTPTLTGVGERAHLREPVPSLETHIEDVARVIEAHELEDVVLVGHSYAGMVVTGAADRLKGRIRRLVYIDAAVPRDGDDFASHVPGTTAEQAERRRAAYRSFAPDGAWIPPMPPATVGIDPSDAETTAWLERRLTPHPLRTWLDPLRFVDGGTAGIPKTYIVCTAPPTDLMGYPLHAQEARNGGEWICREIACGHDTMILRPVETADLVLEDVGR
jgi:pimeloyl-ACP methyl ester carboxylesterase